MAPPSLRAESLALAVTTGSEWALNGILTAHAIGDVLHYQRGQYPEPPLVITPGYGPKATVRLTAAQNLWKAGAAKVNAVGAKPQPQEDLTHIQVLYTVVNAILPAQGRGSILRRAGSSHLGTNGDVQTSSTSTHREAPSGVAETWQQDNGGIARGLASVTWNAIRQVVGATAWRMRFFHRLKLQALSTWDAIRQTPGCPGKRVPPDACGTRTHWDCPGAQALWRVFKTLWRSLGVGGRDTGTRSLFDLTLAKVPPGIAVIGHHSLRQDGRRPGCHSGPRSPTTPVVLGFGVVTTLQDVWRRRCLYRDCLEDMAVTFAEALLHGRLRSAYLTIRILLPVSATESKVEAARIGFLALTQAAQVSPSIHSATCNTRHTFLFFDSGSRGNSGPSGAGSAIAQVGGGHPRARILWMASTSERQATLWSIKAYSLGCGTRVASSYMG
ncbi:unnamed protein product [Phytophthora fragariaefolia]|uniref:Unnamed protein product n=1 Tax=Phytophthora fragariaefolia TaxID=1490495 RepID=A0A9W6XR19_9STRA|nr:unnamed protein product [Phytophthora fragariaefolia]